ncbi:hypothetical protein D6825_03355 [Candidatus Woesearchaeota archaeon]|nr:MAG: hypothetical protein D6825_03355 [Candidatus Woesearchaeota archaeon]
MAKRKQPRKKRQAAGAVKKRPSASVVKQTVRQLKGDLKSVIERKLLTKEEAKSLLSAVVQELRAESERIVSFAKKEIRREVKRAKPLVKKALKRARR